MPSPQTGRCASGSCFKDGTLQCAKCRVTFYCSKTCQKSHWVKHKKHCSAHKPLPQGTFEFLKLSRELRDEIYERLVVARYTPEQQTEHDGLMNDTRDPIIIRNRLDELEERLMISPGTPLWDVKGYQPLVHARGLLNANKQINEELTSTLFSKNIFITPVGEYFRYATPGQLFDYKLNRTSLVQIKHLVISVSTELDIGHHNHSDGVAALKYNFNHIVKSLNQLGNKLDSLKIRFISCFAGRVEKFRDDIDLLLTQPHARPIHLMRMNNTIFSFTHKNVRKFYTSGFDLCDAFEGLKIPVRKFQIYGDVPGEVIERLNRKFSIAAKADASPDDDKSNDQGPKHATSVSVPSTANSPNDPSTSASVSASSQPTTHPHRPTSKFRNKLDDLVEGMAEDMKMMKLAELLAHIPTSLPDKELISVMVDKGVSRRDILSLADMMDRDQ